MCSAAPAAGGSHLLPEQEEQIALQQKGQEGSVSVHRLIGQLEMKMYIPAKIIYQRTNTLDFSLFEFFFIGPAGR